MAASVEGIFRLVDEATPALRTMRAEALKTEETFGKLGATMDASMAKGAKGVDKAAASSAKGTAAMDASGAAATRSAGQHEAAARRTSKAWTDTGSHMVNMGKAVTAGLAGAALGAIDLGVKFQRMTTQFSTQAGLSTKAAGELSKGILNMAASVGQTPNELASGMYHIVSSMDNLIPKAHRTQVELGVLRDSAKLAAVGHSNLTETTYALSSAMNALGLHGVGGANQAMKELNAIVGTGDMHMQDLISSMASGIIPAARTFGVSLHSVGAALAYMTDRGVPAEQAATRLRMSIALLGAPTKQSTHILTALGLSAGEVHTRTKAMSDALTKSGVTTVKLGADLRKPDGIFVALQDLKKHLEAAGVSAGDQATIIARAFGGGRSGGTIMALYNNLDVVRSKYAQQSKVINSFDNAWTLTQQTLGFRLSQAKAGVEALGTRLGLILIPYVEKGITEFTKLAHWFGQNKVAAEALAGVIGGVMVASVVALGVNVTRRVGGATLEFLKLGKAIGALPVKGAQGIGNLFRGGGGVAAAATAETAAKGGPLGAAESMLSGGIGGIRTPGMMPGTLENPLAVVMASSAVGTGTAGPGGIGKAMTAEEQHLAAQGGVVPAKTAAATVEKAAAGGLMSRGAGLAGAGMIGMMGVGASQLAGGLIGGHTGSTVSKIGTYASVGAAAGSLVGPEGAIVGAIGGALVGGLTSLFHSKSFGEKVASSLPRGVGGAQRGAVQSTIASSIDAANQIETRARTRTIAGGSGGRAGGLSGRGGGGTQSIDYQVKFSQLSAVQQQAYLVQANKGGMAYAKTFEAGMNQYKFQDEPTMFANIRKSLGTLPVQFQAYAVQSAVKFSQGLENQGRLAKGSTKLFLKQLESEFPGFERYLGIAANASLATFNKALNFSNTEKNVKAQLDKMRGDFPAVAATMDHTAGSIEQKSQAVVGSLETLASGTGKSAQLARADLKALRAANEADFDAMVNKTTASAGDMSDAVQKGSASAYQSGASNFQKLQAAIATSVAGSTNAVAKGLAMIAQALNAQLKAFGEKPLSVAQIKGLSPGQLAAVASGQVSSGAAASPHAKGGRIAGPPRGDTTPILSSGGNLLGMADGGELIVNRHTERKVDSLLGAFGTRLSGMVANETTPHSMAFAKGGRIPGGAGGYVFPYGPGLSQGRTDMGTDWTGAGNIAAIGDARINMATPQGGNTGWPGAGTSAGGAFINYQLLNGPDANRYVYLAENIDPTVHVGQNVKAGQVIAHARGAYPFTEMGWAAGPGQSTEAQASGNTGDASHGNSPAGIAFTSFVTGLAHGKLVGGGAGGAMGAGPAPIKAPQVGGHGVFALLDNAALTKAAAAATAYAAAHAPAGGSGGGSFTGTLNGPVAHQVAQFMGAAGFDKMAIAGMLGNAAQESNQNPNTPGGGMWQQISNFGSGTGGSLLHQMQTMLPQIQSLKGSMNSAGSPGEAATIFMNQFERPLASAANLPHRIAAANAAMAAGYATGGRVGWGGWNARGGDFTVNRPTVFGAGESGPERVTIKPQHASATATAGGVQITVNIANIDNHREGDIAQMIHREIQRVAHDMEHEHHGVPMESDLSLLR